MLSNGNGDMFDLTVFQMELYIEILKRMKLPLLHFGNPDMVFYSFFSGHQDSYGYTSIRTMTCTNGVHKDNGPPRLTPRFAIELSLFFGEYGDRVISEDECVRIITNVLTHNVNVRNPIHCTNSGINGVYTGVKCGVAVKTVSLKDNFTVRQFSYYPDNTSVFMKISYPMLIQFNGKEYTLIGRIIYGHSHYTGEVALSANTHLIFDCKDQKSNKVINESITAGYKQGTTFVLYERLG